jgi:hypothetical protein
MEATMMHADNIPFSLLNRGISQFRRIKEKMPEEATYHPIPVKETDFTAMESYPPSLEQVKDVTGKKNVSAGLKELISNALEFDISVLLQPKSFIYLLAGTGIFVFQTNNTLTIINLAMENEKLRNQIEMTSSVITAQELKVHELQSIHNIARDAAAIGLAESGVPPVEIRIK